MDIGRRYGPVFIVLAAILWGLDGILRRSLFSLPPSIIVFYEHLIGAILIAPFIFRAWRTERLTRGEWTAIFIVSLLSGVLGTLWFTTALAKVNFISFSVVFLLQKLQPIFAIGAAAMLLKEKLTSRYVGWAALALVAAYFVTFPGGRVNVASGAGTVAAAIFAAGAAFAWGSSTAISRYALVSHRSSFITGLRFWITVPLSLIAVFFLGQSSSLAAPTASHFSRLAIIAFSTGMVALAIYYRGLKQTEAKVSTILELMFPLTAVIIDIFFYDTVLAPSQYLAAVVLMFAVYRVSKLNAAA